MNATEVDVSNHYLDYNPTVLRGAAFTIPPWIMVNSNRTDFKGPLWELFSYLSTSMNIRYEMKPYPDDTKFGHGKYDQVQKKWIGLLGLLHRNIVDFTLVPAGPNPTRCKVARMPLAFAYTDMTILSGRSTHDDPHGVMAFENITLQVWLCCLSCFVAAAVVAWMSEGSNSVLFKRGLAKSRKYNFLRFCWELLGCVFSKEIRIPMMKTATRWILSVWLFGGLVITTIIGGDMTASMTVIPPKFTVDKLDDILQVSRLRPDVMQFSSHHSFIESNNPDLAFRIDKMNSSSPSMRTLMSKSKFSDIVSQKAVQINDRYTLLSGIEKHCNFSNVHNAEPLTGFYFAKNLISAVPVSMFFNKRLSRTFMDAINVRMLRVFQSGVAEVWLQSVMDISPYCFSQSHSGEYAPLEVDHVFPAFKLLAKGLATAAVCFTLEVLAFVARAAYLRIRDTNFNFGMFPRNACLFLWRLKNRNGRKMDTCVAKQRRKKVTFSGSTRIKAAKNAGKSVSPSDFRRMLWKNMSMDSVIANRFNESVVNRDSQASGSDQDSVAGSVNRNEVRNHRGKNPSRETREQVVRYVDTDSFFSNFY